ncbi:2-succinyl-5-enolpyruvyl-6-hydroxy-3-cyclohexene-1-carboxylic-acid synthase [Vibrio sp. S17_S38]|uniref:2-succinyl-5-enolpyruvyl-6-hydroxy-3- cyclohexene-1-carboxylic-acid synthase n=1 Tax=Vibrio sp. S17_S38 TaxID=2720229 RepID=UPI0016800D6F|nr:2-succinyl-5-enolpyruvyl-6-hydroxy-3-cyclohexene-1-carboxylic-acid synthase [Vibrio sp. S17_S38]
MSQAGINRIWAQAILDVLTSNDVKHICIAPGSRSTPLSLEALDLAQRCGVTIHTHFDERGLAFLALGLAKSAQAKGSSQPVAIIVTSGTAVANLLPAVVETGLTGEALVLLTADRPEDLIGVGANQAIQQQGIFSSHVVKSIHLPSPSIESSLADCLGNIQSGLNLQMQHGGSLHINCPYPEPLYIQFEQEKSQYLPYLKKSLSDAGFNSNQCTLMNQVNDEVKSIRIAEVENERQQTLLNKLGRKKGVIVIGKVPFEQACYARKLAQQLGWPLLSDPQSGVTSHWAHYDLWLQHEGYQAQLSQADCILQFGARFVSKRLGFWIRSMANHDTCPYWVFDPSNSVLNPDHLPQLRTVASVEDSVRLLESAIQNKSCEFYGWGDDIQAAAFVAQHAALKLAAQDGVVDFGIVDKGLTECQLALQLGQILSRLNSADLFIGNSLIVRLVDMLSAITDTSVYTNRGASGIDGLIATSTGVQRGNQQAMLTLIGDTSLLYDLNSLALLSHVSKPHVVIVTNNDGGAIFDLLPVPDAQKQTLYQMPHGYQFEFAARQFGLDYAQPTQFSQCLDSIQNYVERFIQGDTEAALVIEVVTAPEQASTQIQTIVQAVKDHVV